MKTMNNLIIQIMMGHMWLDLARMLPMPMPEPLVTHQTWISRGQPVKPQLARHHELNCLLPHHLFQPPNPHHQSTRPHQLNPHHNSRNLQGRPLPKALRTVAQPRSNSVLKLAHRTVCL